MFSIFQTYLWYTYNFLWLHWNINHTYDLFSTVLYDLYLQNQVTHFIFMYCFFTLPSSNKISFRLGHICKYIQFSNVVKESCKLYNVIVTCRFLFRFFLTFLVNLTFLFYSKLMFLPLLRTLIVVVVVFVIVGMVVLS